MSGGVSKQQPSCPSDLVLDRYRLSDLQSALQRELEAHIDGCPRCAERLAAQQQESASFSEQLNIANLAVDALQRAGAEQRRWSWARVLSPRWLSAITAAACVLLAVLLWPRLASRPGGDDDRGLATRVKGRFSVKLQVKRGDRQWRASSTDWLEPGDNVRFVLKTQTSGYLYIVGVDAARTITLYEPYGGEQPRRYQPAERHEVPGAIELDDTLGDERLIALLCKQRLEPAVVRSAMKKAAANLSQAVSPLGVRALSIPPSARCAQVALRIRKRAPR